MKIKAIILGSLFLGCLSYATASSECILYADPNDYIDDPNILENGLLECGDPNLTQYGFIPPTYWERIPHPLSIDQSDCYAELRSSFFPYPDPNEGWGIPAPYEGDRFVLLSSGGFDTVPDGDIKGSMISQRVSLSEGDIILGAYFFGTFDWPEYNDYCRIYAKLDPNYTCPYPDPNEAYGAELVTNAGFDSDTFWTKTGLWVIADPNVTDPNIVDPNITDPNIVDPNTACYNPYLLGSEASTLSQTVLIEPNQTYLVSIDVLKGSFNSGSDFFSVTLGDQTSEMTAYTNKTITQLFTPTESDILIIAWENEGTISIDNVSVRNTAGECFQYPAEEFTIIYKSVGREPNDIPRFESTGDWVPFEYSVEPNQVGPYYLRCEVVDFQDSAYNSYLAIDGLRICKGGRSTADLNNDCDVNLQDYSILSEAWLAFCPDSPFYDPNSYDPNDYPTPTDPNIPCQLADFDNSWFVDSNDLVFMSDQWLYNTSSE